MVLWHLQEWGGPGTLVLPEGSQPLPGTGRMLPIWIWGAVTRATLGLPVCLHACRGHRDPASCLSFPSSKRHLAAWGLLGVR